MHSSFGLLGVESHDFSHAEKERKNCLQSWANSQNDNYFHSNRQSRTILSENSCHFVNLLSFSSSSFFLSLRKSHDSTPNSQKTRGHVELQNLQKHLWSSLLFCFVNFSGHLTLFNISFNLFLKLLIFFFNFFQFFQVTYSYIFFLNFNTFYQRFLKHFLKLLFNFLTLLKMHFSITIFLWQSIVWFKCLAGNLRDASRLSWDF